jgi:hypothetical protein
MEQQWEIGGFCNCEWMPSYSQKKKRMDAIVKWRYSSTSHRTCGGHGSHEGELFANGNGHGQGLKGARRRNKRPNDVIV